MNGVQQVLGLRFRPLENLSLKLVSLVLATALWSVVPDPSVPHIVTGVPVRLENVPPELALSEIGTPLVDVRVRGAAARTRGLAPGELSPRVDLFGAINGVNTIVLSPDAIDAPFGVSVQSIEPSQLQLVLEERVRKELPVAAVVEGSPAEGWEIVDKVLLPGLVSVTGPRSRVEALDSVSTEAVSVSGQRESLTRSVALLTSDPLVRVEGTANTLMTIVIEEVAITRQLEGIPVELIGALYRIVINPDTIGLVLRGPPSLLQELTAAGIRASLDVGTLQPREDDYHVEPRIDFLSADLSGRIEVIAMTPQQRIDVHVYPQPPR